MVDTRVTRRGFVKTSVAAATAVSVGWRVTSSFAMDTVTEEVKSTRSYNPQMEYRRLGKTGLWVSAVCMGGHWKRIDKVIGAAREINPYAGPGQTGRHCTVHEEPRRGRRSLHRRRYQLH